jgi:hypothetical protein
MSINPFGNTWFVGLERINKYMMIEILWCCWQLSIVGWSRGRTSRNGAAMLELLAARKSASCCWSGAGTTPKQLVLAPIWVVRPRTVFAVVRIGRPTAKGTYNARLRAVYEPTILQKTPRSRRATAAPSSRERTTGARAPRLNRRGSALLYAESTTRVDPVRKYGAKIDPSEAQERKGATSANLREGKENW